LKRDRTKGFTLVELLLVISILGIIVGIAIPAFMGQKQRARVIGDAKANATIIRMGLEARKAEMGVYGPPGTTTYKADGTLPEPDLIPSFRPKGNSKMDYKIKIEDDGLTYIIEVADPARTNAIIAKFDQNGEVIESS